MTQFCSKMLALERIIGKDVLSVICKQLHQTHMRELNAEFSLCVRLELNDRIIWRTTNNGFFSYNFRSPSDKPDVCNKYGRKVGPLPKNY